MAKSRNKFVRSTTRSALRPVDDTKRSASAKNSTKAQPIAGDATSITAFIEEFFSEVPNRFNATAGYGLQHLNANGAAHPDAVMTKSNGALTKLAAQAIEILSQRAALSGQDGASEMLGEHGDPAQAKKFIADLSKFANSRTKAIKADTDKAFLDNVAEELGIDTSELVPAPAKTSKKKAKA